MAQEREKVAPLKVAYILFRFPVLTETFVANEIWEMQQRGVRVHIFSLLRPKDEPVQHVSQQLVKDAQYAPELWSWRLWWAQLYFLIQSPRAYLGLLAALIRQPYRRPYRIPKRLFIFLKAVALAYVLKDMSVQLLHAHFAALPGAGTRIIAELLGLPFTVTVHAYDIFRSSDFLCFTTSSAARVIAISEFNKRSVLNMCPAVKEQSVTVIHCGVDLERFRPSDAVDKGNKPLLILSVGGLVPKKGHAYLIRACHQLKGKGLDFQCSIIGGGPGEESLSKLVRELDLEDMVKLSGPCTSDDVLRAYREHDLFVLACVTLPSGDRDGIPVVLMEAMAMQMPAISTSVSGVSELVRHEETGWLVPERDVDAIVEAVTRLAADKPLREQLGRNGRALVEKEFEIRRNVTQLADVFRQVTEEN